MSARFLRSAQRSFTPRVLPVLPTFTAASSLPRRMNQTVADLKPYPDFSTKTADRLRRLDPRGTVFASPLARLAAKFNAINLGQGFPTFPVPDFIRGAAATAVNSPNALNQYTRSEGHVRLVNALAKFYEPKFGRKLDPLKEIITTVGATEAIFDVMISFLDKDDEVILIEPFYDSYPASAIISGAKPVYVSLIPTKRGAGSTSNDWKLDFDALKKAVNPGKTKLLVINNPHNPIGKVYTREELQKIADFAIENDLLVMSDEVYETLVYSDAPNEHIKIASLPGMWERTLTVGSVGKMLSVTGWKIGWVVAPQPMIRTLWLTHQWNPYSVSTPLQEATAAALEEAQSNGYFPLMKKEFEARRNQLCAHLTACGLPPIQSHGGYFVLADTSRILPRLGEIGLPEILDEEDWRGESEDFTTCRYLIKKVGVGAIPPSVFFSDGHKDVVKGLTRFAFCKTEDVLDAAGKKLRDHFAA